MKKLALTTVCALAVTVSAFAQGTLSWSTIVPAAFTAQTNATTVSPLFTGQAPVGGTIGSTAIAANSFYYTLLYNTTAFNGSAIAQPGSLSALASWIDTGMKATNSLTVGRAAPVSPTTAYAVSDWSGGIGTLGGTTNYIMMVGWSANLGTSWTAALTAMNNWVPGASPTLAFFGMSTVGWIIPNQGNPGATVFATLPSANGRPISSLNTQLYALPIPEPSTFALAGLGALSLLVFRRRQ